MSLCIAAVALIASLQPVHGSNCDAGFCGEDDAASLLQVKQEVEEGRARLHEHAHEHDHTATGRIFWQCNHHKCLSVLQSGIDNGVKQDFKRYIDFTPLAVRKDVEMLAPEWHEMDYRCIETWKTTALKQPPWIKLELPTGMTHTATNIKNTPIGLTGYGRFVAGQMKCMRWRSKLNRPGQDVEDSCKCWMHAIKEDSKGGTTVNDAYEKNWPNGVPPPEAFAGDNNLIVPSQLRKKPSTGQEVPESVPQQEKSFNPMDQQTRMTLP